MITLTLINARKKYFAAGLSLVCLLTTFQACKPAASNSGLSDAATTSTFKTGFFLPRTKSQFQLVGKKSPVSVDVFISKARQLANDPKIALLADAKITYATTVNGNGEQLLLMISKNSYPLPVMSIVGTKLFSWHQQIEIDQAKNDIGVFEMFVKAPYKKLPLPLIVENMYVRRIAQNDKGTREPVLVPWLAHVRSETDAVVTFQLGNSVLEGRLGYALLEFRQISTKPIWYLIGKYKDKDVEAGSVFWRTNDTDYFSITKGKALITKWRVQDGDSLDRISPVPMTTIKVPTAVSEFIEKLPPDTDKNHPKNIAIEGFDSWSGDAKVFQLDRNSMTIVDTSKSNFGLTASELDSNAETLTDEDYAPRVGGFSLGWFSSNKPVTTSDPGDGSGVKAVAYTDQNGQSHGGRLLASRNTFVPGGYFSGSSYEMRHYVLNATNNTVSEVAANGRVLKSNMPVSEFQNRQQTNIRIDQMQREGGSDAAAMKQSNSMLERSSKQLAISESYIGGNSTSEMAQGLGKTLAVGQVRTQISHGLSNDGKALEKVLGDQVVDGLNGKIEGYQDVGNTFMTSSEKVAAGEATKYLGNHLAQGAWANGGISATASKQIGKSTNALSDMYFKYDSLNSKGIFDPTDPDAAFNRSVGTARVAGSGVQNISGLVFSGNVKGLGEGSRGQAAVNTLVKDSTGVLFDETAALSHGINAQTIEREREQVLENVGQRMRDAQSAEQSMESLSILNKTIGDVTTPQDASQNP